VAWRNRYINGEFEQVWDELYALGSGVRRLDHFDEAMAVARETMHRVRANCQTLITRLESLGWRFGYAWSSDAFEDDIAHAPDLLGEPMPPPVLDEIERRYGALPLAFRAFYEIVGEVNFVGTPFDRPAWPGIEDGLDPLYIAGASSIGSNGAAVHGNGRVEVAPDFLVKYFISGVGSLFVELPAPRADAPILFEGEPMSVQGRQLTLVRYLRYAMRGGGFLGFMPGNINQSTPIDDLAYLTRDLLPI
jgi:hypothetical protein